MPISADEIIEAVMRMRKKDREAFIENLLAICLLITCKAYRRQENAYLEAWEPEWLKILLLRA